MSRSVGVSVECMNETLSNCINSINDNIRDKDATIKRWVEMGLRGPTKDEILYAGKEVCSYAISYIDSIGVVSYLSDGFSYGYDKVKGELTYYHELCAFDRAGVSADSLAIYMGTACSYRIDDSDASFIYRNGNGPSDTVVLISSTYSPATYYMFDEMLNGAGVHDIDPSLDEYEFDHKLDKMTRDPDYNNRHRGNANTNNSALEDRRDYYNENKEYLLQLYHGGFNMYEYMEGHTEEDFLRLCEAFNEVDPDTNYDFDDYVDAMNREWRSVTYGY